MHDLGKLYIPDCILNKSEKLTDDEYEIIKTHASIGAKILDRTAYKSISSIVALHHERIDGLGYVGVKGDSIPIESRIVAVADTFSAITTERLYNKKKTIPEAIEILKEESDKQLDKFLVNCFLKIPIEKLVMIDNMLKSQYRI